MLLHLALTADWQEALRTGRYPWSTRGLMVQEVGFVHCCRDDAQLTGVVDRFYADLAPTDRVVLELDPYRLGARGLRVVDEPGADGVEETFPHVYGGELRPADVVATRRWPRP